MSRPEQERKLTVAGAVAAVAPVVAVGGMAYANYLLNPDLLKFSDHKNYPLYAMLSAMLVGTGTSAVAGLMQKNHPLIHAVSNLLLLGGTAIMAMGDVAQLQKSDSAKVLAVGLTLFLYSTAAVFYHAARAMNNLVSEAPRLEVSFTAGGAAGALFFAIGNAMNLYAAHQKGDQNKMAAAGIFDGASALFMYTMIYATMMKMQEMRARARVADAPSLDDDAPTDVVSGEQHDSTRANGGLTTPRSGSLSARLLPPPRSVDDTDVKKEELTSQSAASLAQV